MSENTDWLMVQSHAENQELKAINEELLEACKAIAALADGQGRANMLEVAGQAKQAIAKAEGG